MAAAASLGCSRLLGLLYFVAVLQDPDWGEVIERQQLERLLGGGDEASSAPWTGEGHMDQREKKRLRDYIGQRLDVSSTRLTDDEAAFLSDFLDEYDETYKGRSETRTRSRVGWSSDGKYTRRETLTDTFTDDVGIRQDYEYEDDDGQSGTSTNVIMDARGILNWFKEYSSRTAGRR